LNNHQGKHWNYRTIVQLPAAGLAAPIAGPLTASPGGLTEPPVLGSFHGADVAFYLFGTLPPTASRNSLHIMSTFISFVNHLDPNLHGLADLPLWPEWDQGDVRTYQFRESGVEVIRDDYRREAMDFLAAQAGTFKI
jgi:acetylcholinesterase